MGKLFDGRKVLARTLLFRSDEKLVEMPGKGGALNLAGWQALEHAMGQGGVGVHAEVPIRTLLPSSTTGDEGCGYSCLRTYFGALYSNIVGENTLI